MTKESLLFSLLRAEICGRPVEEDVKSSLTPEQIGAMYALAAKHDVAHILGQALSKLGLLGKDPVSQKMQESGLDAFGRYLMHSRVLEQVCRIFENANIPFMPLKGAVLRAYYPEPWLRTSCDIDILLHPEDLDRAMELLTENHGYKSEGRGYHDVSLFSPEEVHVELHFALTEEGRLPKANGVVAQVWEHAAVTDGWSFRYEMTGEMFYFYHILHMAYHFYCGGCGVRPLMDLWVLDQKMPCDGQKRDELLEQGGLLTFTQQARELAGVWFEDRPHTELTRSLEQFILFGGAYGSVQNQMAVQQAKRGGKLGAILGKLFLPYGMLKGHYPVLEKHKWLTPVFQVVRWFRLLSPARWKRSVRQLQRNMETSKEAGSETAALLKELGL